MALQDAENHGRDVERGERMRERGEMREMDARPEGWEKRRSRKEADTKKGEGREATVLVPVRENGEGATDSNGRAQTIAAGANRLDFYGL